MRHLLIAIQFLTIFPVSVEHEGEDDFARAVPYFPVVGSLAGLSAAIIAAVALWAFDPLTASVVTIAFLCALSGALHMDGLADTCDGFLSARPREKKLIIMQDSCSGVMGVVGILFLVLLKVSLLYSLAAQPRLFVVVSFCMPLAGRVSQVVLMSLLPYARETGLGLLFWESEKPRARYALGALMGVVLLLGAFTSEVAALDALLLGVWILAVCVLFSHWCMRAIGGGTGDTLGAITEIAELATLFYFAV
jgi:adenosylcobinamide-GDP ribazoletransferase